MTTRTKDGTPMAPNRLHLLGQTEDEAIETMLDKLARAQGAEAHAAEIVADECIRGHFRYAPALGWLQWDGRRWDDDPEAGEKVVETVRRFNITKEKDYRAKAATHQSEITHIATMVMARMDTTDAADLKEGGADAADIISAHGTDAEAKAYNDAVLAERQAKGQADIWMNLLSLAKISSLTKLCRAMDGIRTRTTDFDEDPELLNCANCVVNLRTGETQEHSPELLMTKLAGGEYRADATHPAWDKALQALHPETTEWVQERMGQTFTGHRPADDSLVISAGGGENGKSAVMEACLRAAGTYGDIIDHKVLLADPSQHTTEKMDLRGLRLAYMDETPEEGRLDTQRMKGIIGTAKIKARHMRKDTVTFPATHTMWINTNFLPQVDTTDHGTWRRLFALPWPFRFRKPWEQCTEDNDKPGDLTLKPTLETDPGVPAAVLAWVVRGAVAHFARTEPARPPSAIEEATTLWRTSVDVGLQFATERLASERSTYITADEMFREFSEFLEGQGKRAWSRQLMNTRLEASMREAGIHVDRTPTQATTVRADDTQSLAPTMSETSWPASNRANGNQPGKKVRMWRGVRFRTRAEIGQTLTRAS